MAGNETQGEVLVPGSAAHAAHAEQVEQTSTALHSAIEKQISGPAVADRLSAAAAAVNYADGGKAGQLDYLRPVGNDGSIDKLLPKCDITEKCSPLNTTPSPEDVKKAQDAVDGQISKLIPPEDQKTLKAAQDNLLAGDAKGFAGALANMDPERRRAFVEEMNKNLNESKSGMHMVMDHAGNVVVYNDGNRGVEIAPNGDTTVRAIEHGADGSIIMKGEVLGADGDKALKGLSDGAVNSVNNGGDNYGDILKKLFPEKPFPEFPEKPRYPFEPREPHWPDEPHHKPIWWDEPRKLDGGKDIEMLLKNKGQ